jgi:hypothetical protein
MLQLAKPWMCVNSANRQQELKKSIASMIDEMEAKGDHSTRSISRLSSLYGIKVRRLYDLVNVLSAIGCCRRTGPDQLTWIGRSKIIPSLKKLRKERGIDDLQRTLCELFPVSGCVGLSNLTVNLLLLFCALRTDRIDLRFAGNLFSRQTTRYKSTLCKLYQINYTLCAAGVSNRTSQVCEVVLLNPYLDFPVIPNAENMPVNPAMLDSLLNRRKTEPIHKYIQMRRKEIAELFEGSFLARGQSTSPDQDSS